MRPGSLLAFHIVLRNTEDVALDSYSSVSILCDITQDSTLFFSVTYPFPHPKTDQNLWSSRHAAVPSVQKHVGVRGWYIREQELIKCLSQPLLDTYRGFWETIRCGGNTGKLIVQVACSNTRVSVPEGGHTSRITQTLLRKEDAFSMTYACKSSFTSDSDFTYKNSQCCVS